MPGEYTPSAHEAAMIAKMDANTAAVTPVMQPVAPQPPAQVTPPVVPPVVEPKPAAAQRPEHVPEKFWDAVKGAVNTEALLKSYTELESKGAKPAEKPAEGTPPEGTPATPEEAVKAAKLDMDALSQEFLTNGAISEASYKALEGAGISKDMVDSYIAGQVALAQAHDAQGFAIAGGQEQYMQMTQWAAANLSAEDQAAFNTAVAGSAAQMKQAITALKAQYEAARGTDPTLLGGRQAAGGSEADTPFASRAEVVTAMSDPRYRKDSAYRAVVERRVGLMDNF
jgi:hypothetical protein